MEVSIFEIVEMKPLHPVVRICFRPPERFETLLILVYLIQKYDFTFALIFNTPNIYEISMVVHLLLDGI